MDAILQRRRTRPALWMSCIVFGILLGSFSFHSVHGASPQKRQAGDALDQPRIVTVGGNLIFQTGTNHNITFRPGGVGTVVLDGVDLRQLITQSQENKEKINQLQQGTVANLESRFATIDDRFNELTNRITALENTINTSTGPLGERVSRLENQVQQLNQLLTANECQSNPCRNGGTCVDLYNGFSCQCLTGWMGPACENDVDECRIYAGTDMGCQNGATCLNTVGSFSCTCPPNRYGIRCTEEHDDCDQASNEALCAHGTCHNLPRDVPGQAKYRCMCEAGWTNNGANGPCNIDVNECDNPRSPCSTNPPVNCINLPGSFTCGPCPTGFTGNGYTCNDVNECAVNNGGCSLAPPVECINTPGSRRCGTCPPGYQGNGESCWFVGICGQNNGGCHPMATCRESPGIQGRDCLCLPGYVGNGIGPGGCSAGTGGPCSNNPCVHGSCQPNGASYTCSCLSGWSGFNCNQQIDGCTSNPCRNGGTCSGGSDGSFTCTCTATYTGATCQQSQQTCGGRLPGEAGSFRYPSLSAETYLHSQSCAWTISTVPNKIIILTFPLFKLEYSYECSSDFLQIHDGISARAHQIGRFCGTQLNGQTLNTSSSDVYLWFRSDASTSHDGFEVIWNSALPTCGGNQPGSGNGVITSPGYPGNYPINRDCVWTISVPLGYRIRFAFGQLNLENHPNCSYDYLEVRDGLRTSDPLLRRFCSTIQPEPLETPGPYALVQFHSDESYSARGFQISYSSFLGCGASFTDDRGSLMSPGYPYQYQHDALCIWTISVPQGEAITFTISDIDLEYHGNCAWDFVEVREGLNERGSFVGRFCGNNTPPAFVSRGNNLWIRFKSDRSHLGRGFLASWIVACGGNFTNATGELRSPFFPNPYPSDKECIYLIRQPEGTTITLNFNSFDIEASWGTNCTFDFLEVRNGPAANSPLIQRLCGSSVPATIESAGNTLWLKFKSDGSRQNHGFRATYTTTTGSGSGCGGILTTSAGVLQWPSPQSTMHPHNLNCTWLIRVIPGFVIRLTFNTFVIEAGSNCGYDSIEIFDNSTATNSLGRYCGSTQPPVLTSSDNVMTVVLITDRNVVSEGFSATYFSLNATTVCGRDIRNEAGVLTSPNYPGNSPHNSQCQWTITVPTGRQILLNITDFAMESHPNCDWDYLEIRNGGFVTSPLIGKYCGTTIDRIIRSHSNRLFLRMATDPSVNSRGFSLYYDGTVSGCGGDMTAVTGTFVSPNYPMSPGWNSECFWQITVAQGSVVNLHFTDFFLGSYCSWQYRYTYVEVRDQGPLGNVLQKFCENPQDQIVSLTNKMWIKMRISSSYNARGFQAVYFANCNNRLKSHSGVIESPNFPRPYPANRDCSWVVEATMGNTINASFSHFEVQPGSSGGNCNNDYLELRDGENARGRLIGRYCGTTSLPPDVATTSRFLFVRFVSDSGAGHNGFRLEYEVDGCGGVLPSPTGRFTSLNYPQPYPHQRECIWALSAAPGNRVELTVVDFDVEEHANCSFDALEIYGGMDLTSPLLSQLCHSQNSSQIFTSTGSYMVVRFVTDYSQSGRGFNATYRSVSGGCGGNFSTRTGVIMSLNYPNPYPINTDCIYTITVEAGRSIILTFEDFQLEGSSSCTFDYVAIYDTPDFSSTPRMKVCGRTLPQPSVIRSFTNQLFVRFRSDHSINHGGFKASYKTGCGGLINPDTDGQLTSPGWPTRYEILNNCTWVIQSSNADDRITLTFLHMELENNNNNCSDDYVRVLNGNDLDAPEVGRYCGTTNPAAITSFGSAMVVQFITDSTHQRRGFQAAYTTSTSACGGDFTAEHGPFDSPGYPDSYPNNYECVWTITSSPGNSIMLSFSFFNLESSDHCNNDFVEVRRENSGGAVLGRYCGNNLPTNQTTGNKLWIKFKSNENVTGQGFMATYNSLYGGPLIGNTGQLASPLYPNNYPIRVDYTWVITADLGLRIQPAFQMMDMEISSTCQHDYVRLVDGPNGDAPELGKFCGVSVPVATILTSSNQLRVEFHSDPSIVGRGFLMNWQATSGTEILVSTPFPPVSVPSSQPACGGLLNATENFQTIESPGFPNGYPTNRYCTWTITRPVGSQVLLQFNNLSLPGGMPNCWGSDRIYIQPVRDSYEYPYYYGRSYCGVVLPQPVSFRNTLVYISFRAYQRGSRVGNFSGFSLSYKSVCGGIVKGPQGSVTSPGYPANYPINTNCTWTFLVLAGRTARVTFNGTFGINGQAPQCSDYVEFFNGRDTSSPSLGRFCGSSAPATIVSSSNLLTATFLSNSDGLSGTGFNMSFTEVQLACGGSVVLTETVTEGFIASPNYPQNYPHNVECVWVITVPANRRARVDFVGAFSIETHVGCQFDFIEIRDGGTANSRLLGAFCGTSLPSTQESNGNVMYAKFRTDGSILRTGFRARVSFDLCGGRRNAANGSIYSPNYPSNYPSNVDCEWFIQVPMGHYITFSFVAFNLQWSSNCSLVDYVEIREFNSTGNALLGAACGGSRPTVADSSDSYAYVKFHSNNQQSLSGFMLNFAASIEECGGLLTTPTGTITSPGYPRVYTHRRVCEWRILAPEGRKVNLVFSDMDLEGSPYSRFCYHDYVEVRNGYLPRSPIIGRYCGPSVPTALIESSSNSMKIIFYTDYSINGRGFSATYSTNNPSDCGGVLNGTDTFGIIESPGFSSNISYNGSEQCIWHVMNRMENSSIAIQFLTLDLERQGECNFDFVEIREGSDENGMLVNNFCRFSPTVPSVIISPAPSMWIRFVSDMIIHRTGFQLTYTFTGCGGILTSSSGSISSPNYPSSYAPNTYCAWKIVAPEGSQIRLRFGRIVMNPVSPTNCSAVYLEIFNGGLYSSPSAMKSCSGTPATFVSQSNEVRVVFFAGPRAVAASGFRLTYSFATQGCGNSIHDQQGVITSPNWPANYNASQECVWDVTVANGYHILWQFNAPFEFETSIPCTLDYVEIFELSSLGRTTSLGRYCGSNVPPANASTGNSIRIKFRSNSQNQYNGFSLNFTSGCGATFTDGRGTIMSPGYPNNYANNLNCVYNITGDPQKYLTLTFDPDHFGIEGWSSRRSSSSDWRHYPWGYWGGSRRCYYDYVEVTGVVNSTRQRPQRFCGTVAPQTIGNFGGMSIRFKTSDFGTDMGWIATYEQSDCGGRYTDPSGSFTSPSHPQRYLDYANCTWTITVATNRIIRLNFYLFDLELHQRCVHDYVDVFDGLVANQSFLIGRFCGQQLPGLITSTTNSMIVRFVSDDSIQGQGFSAAYSQALGPASGCGGLRSSSSGSIQSPDVDGDGIYESDLDCVWQIIVQPNASIAVQFSQFNLDPAGCYDFLEVREGLFPSDPLVGKFCGGPTPSNFSSTTQMLYIRFVTNSAAGSAGFSLQYRAVPRACGTAFYSGNVTQVLSSPNYPRPYGANVDCSWVIDAPENEKVEITVTTLDIDNRTGCETDYLQMLDIMDESVARLIDSTQSVTVCGSTVPATYTSHTRTVRVSFRTSNVGVGRRTGFQLNYKTASCNRTYTEPSGFLTSPRYPANYPTNANCHTIIRTSPGFKLAIFFSFVDIEAGGRACVNDYLEVYNGSEVNSSRRLAKLCSNSLPNPIFFSNNEARLVFATDYSLTHRGYALTYTASTTGCGGTLTTHSGVFASPEYPSNIAYAVTCQWSIAISPRRTVVFSISVRQQPGATSAVGCASSSVTVYNGPNTSAQSVMYCTEEGLTRFSASSNRILVVYTSSNSANSTNIAFTARYTSN